MPETMPAVTMDPIRWPLLFWSASDVTDAAHVDDVTDPLTRSIQLERKSLWITFFIGHRSIFHIVAIAWNLFRHGLLYPYQYLFF